MKLFLNILVFSFLCFSTIFAFEPHFMSDPAISPNGEQICFSYLSDLWIVPFEGGNAKRLTCSQGVDSNPVFSPDGSSIIFNSDRDGWIGIFIIPLSGDKAESISKEGQKIIDFFPDGNHLLTVADEPGFRNKFFKLDLDGSFYEISAFGGSYGAVSKNGDKIIFDHWGKPTREAYRGSGNGEIYEYNLKFKKYIKLTNTNFTERYPVYSNTSNSIFFAGSDGKVFQLFQVDNYDFSNRKQLTFFENWSVRDIGIAKINNRLVFEKFDEIWRYNPEKQTVEKIRINILEDCLPNTYVKENVQNRANNFVISPNGKLAVFSYKYDLFAVPTKGGNVKQITTNQAGIKSNVIMNDNQTIFFTSYEKGELKLFKVNVTNFNKIEKYNWDDDKNISDIYASQNQLLIRFSDEKRRDKIAISDSLGSKIETIIDNQFIWQNVAISKDKEFALYSELREQLWSNHLFVYDFKTAEKHQVYNFDGFMGNFFWGKDGKSAFFKCGDEICRIDLISKEDFANNKDNWKPIFSSESDAEKSKNNNLEINFEGIEKRIKPIVSKIGYNEIIHIIDDEKLYYYNTFENKTEIRKIDYYAKKDESIYSFSKKISKIEFNENSGCFYFLDGKTLKEMNSKTQKITIIDLDFKYEYDNLQLNKDIFTQVWRKYGFEFYDPEMHGVDWNEAYNRFYKYTDFAINTKILDVIIEEMMGEVNASHTRFTPRKYEKKYQKAFGGFVLDYENYPEKGIKFKKNLWQFKIKKSA